MTDRPHTPVLLEPTIRLLQPRPGGRYIDGTLGAGGHAAALLTASGPDGRLLGLDQDPTALQLARATLAAFGDRAVLVHANFRTLHAAATANGFTAVDGILLDLGLSSMQLDTSTRGFAFSQDAPLDMRMDPAAPTSAAELVNGLSERELADLIYEYGEEKASRRIARAIIAARPIETTGALAQIVARAAGGKGHWRIHPATRTFQALRIAVNDELAQIDAALPLAWGLLRPGGRLAGISFHSGEDRRIKRFLVQQAEGCTCPPQLPVCVCGNTPEAEVLTRRAIAPTAGEVASNPRSASARLRAARKLDQETL